MEKGLVYHKMPAWEAGRQEDQNPCCVTLDALLALSEPHYPLGKRFHELLGSSIWPTGACCHCRPPLEDGWVGAPQL